MEAPPAWANPHAQVQQQQQPKQQLQSPTPATTTTTAQQHEAELFSKYSTLDEPVIETIMRDVRAVTTKLSLILSQRPFSTTTGTTSSSNSITSIYYNSLTPVYNYSVVSTSDPTTTTTTTTTTAASTTTMDANGTTTTTNTTPSTTSQQQTPILSDDDRNIIKQLKDWDLWGPLVLCLLLGIVLSMSAPTNQAALTFAAVFISISVGSTIVTINVQLLGGTISFFQSVCVLGYSVFPLVISAMVIGGLKLLYIHWLWIHSIIVIVGSIWSLRISSLFISLYVRQERRALALYPVVYYYAFLAWLILLF
jgi:protein YIPF6